MNVVVPINNSLCKIKIIPNNSFYQLTYKFMYDFFRQAFISVEKGYLDSIDELLAKRLQYELPPNLNQDEVC